MKFSKLHIKSRWHIETLTICEGWSKNPNGRVWTLNDDEVSIKPHNMMAPSILENMSFTLECDACGVSHTHMTSKAKGAGMKEWQFKPSPSATDFMIFKTKKCECGVEINDDDRRWCGKNTAECRECNAEKSLVFQSIGLTEEEFWQKCDKKVSEIKTRKNERTKP